MFNLQSTPNPNPFTNCTVSFDTKFLPLSEIMTDGQHCLLTNCLKLLMKELESICGTTSSITPRVPAYLYKVTHTIKGDELSLAKILLTNSGPKSSTPVAKKAKSLFIRYWHNGGETWVLIRRSYILFANNTFSNNISDKLPTSANPKILS